MGAEFLFLIGGIMATILLIIIYIDFVGLGLPDSLFGTAWPVIYPEFGLQLSMANCVTLLVTGCTIVSSLLSARLINRFGTAKVTAVSTMLTALALLGFSVSGSLWWMCLCALPLGFGAGAIDSGLNNYVALHYNAMHMNFLHCAYGAGIALSPYIMSTVLGRGQNWRIGYRCAFFIQLAITLVTVVSVPLWAKMQSGKAEQSDAPKTISIAELAKNAHGAGCVAAVHRLLRHRMYRRDLGQHLHGEFQGACPRCGGQTGDDLLSGSDLRANSGGCLF